MSQRKHTQHKRPSTLLIFAGIVLLVLAIMAIKSGNQAPASPISLEEQYDPGASGETAHVRLPAFPGLQPLPNDDGSGGQDAGRRATTRPTAHCFAGYSGSTLK